MRVVHRIAFRVTGAQRGELEALGVEVPTGVAMPGGGDPFVAFDFSEEQPNWSAIRVFLRRWGISEGQTRTEFTKKELETARWLEIGAWHHGYPQPDEDIFGYRQATYDLTDWCERCGIGKRQRAPFQMKGEPKWGKKGILQLIWIYDELFVTPTVWSSVFKPSGIGCRSVTDTKATELKTVVQLIIEEEVGIATDGLASEKCGRCGRVKYLPVTRGPFPMLAQEPRRAIARTQESFGSGGQADKRILISSELARSLAGAKVRGALLTPVDSPARL